MGHRTTLATPLLREGVAIGAILIRRLEVRPFTDKQIKLLETFAAQAVIAIENVRLFKELQERNAELREALEHQTATSDILSVIARSPTDLQPVLDAVAESAGRLCDARDTLIDRVDGDALEHIAAYGPMPMAERRRPLSRGTPAGRAVIDRQTIHVHDVVPLLDTEYPDAKARQQITGTRTALVAPLIREGVAIGTIQIRRPEVRPFSEKQIALLQTFADQAVIAIENVRLFQELKEALEQQTATSEILGVIASSPTDVQPVLDTVAEHAARLCDARDALIFRANGDRQERVASYGSMPVLEETSNSINFGGPVGRAIGRRQTIHVHDLAASESEFPGARNRGIAMGVRTALIAPLLREGVSIGAIYIRRNEVRPFSERQIKLLETFASQAVIAIENVRLFKELQVRNRDLTEALEQQTATGEVLRVIASSPTELQPVLDVVAENATRLCDATSTVIWRLNGDRLQQATVYGPMPGPRMPLPVSRGSVVGRAVVDRQTVHIEDVAAEVDTEFPEAKALRQATGTRTTLAIPLMREGVPIGVVNIRRTDVRPFTEKQIALLRTFADQAVIAIENVRLFQELKESLEQQTATSEILGVIASSPTDIQPVLDTIAENAARVCSAEDASIRLVEGNLLRLAAHRGSIASLSDSHGVDVDSLDRGRRWIPARAVLDRETIHIHDITAVESEFPETAARARRVDVRTILTTPLLREGVAIGVIHIRRTKVDPFTDKQVALLKTFAAQAVIAIENVRLFKEIQERNAELREALEHQTATSEVLGIISRSPTDVQPVLDAIVESAARVCGIDDVVLRLQEGNNLVSRAHFGSMLMNRIEIRMDEPQYRWVREHGTLHIPDIHEQNDNPMLGSIRDWRSFLSVPLRQQGEFIGTLNARRTEVCPFTPAQIKLLETFADQAVIAIENVRLVPGTHGGIGAADGDE